MDSYHYYDYMTPLKRAADGGHNQCMELLVQAGADVNFNEGGLAVLFAAQKGHYACVAFLMQAGADVNVTSDCGEKTPIIEGGWNVECVNLLLEAGADVNVLSPSGFSALKCAAKKGGLDAMEKLIAAGADVNSNEGFTALVYACWSGHTQAMDVLVRTGTDMSDFNNSDHTALVECVYRKQPECLNRLAKLGADVNLTNNKFGFTPLVLASGNFITTCVKALLSAGADVNKKTKKGATPLVTAVVSEGHYSWFRNEAFLTVQLLLKAGAQVNIRNLKSRNALTRYLNSRRYPKEKIATLLYAAGETLPSTTIDRRKFREGRVCVTTYIPKMKPNDLTLMSVCRTYIRRYLFSSDPHGNLFVRVPKLQLPVVLAEFLLHDTSLNEDVEEESDYD